MLEDCAGFTTTRRGTRVSIPDTKGAVVRKDKLYTRPEIQVSLVLAHNVRVA